MRRRLARYLTAVLSALLTAGLVQLVAVPSASASEVGVPVDGVLALEGRGYGHGRGMSQYGAQGAAVQGLTWPQIVAFYYPGTTRYTEQPSWIRVWVSADTDGSTDVVPPPEGLTVRSSGQTATLPSGARYDRWRVRLDGSGAFVLERLDDGAWWPYPTPMPLTTDVTFNSTAATLRIVQPNGRQQEVRGAVRAVNYLGSLRTVVVLPMEDYLRSVVPAEMPASWRAQALSAQSVAARTYAARLRALATGAWDVCDTVSCQVFPGTALYESDGTLVARYEYPSTDAAVQATAGVLLHYSGAPALTEFSAASGGWTAPGGVPYLVAQRDPYDGVVPSEAHAWSTTVQASRLEAAYPGIGTLRQVRVDSRNGLGENGGRILLATVVGSRSSLQVTGAQLRVAMGTRSDWFWFTGGGEHTRDWDGDAQADVLAIDPSGRLLLYPGNGVGGFLPSRQIGNGWSGLGLVTQVGDWDGDGRPDVVARDAAGRLLLYQGDGSGGFLGARQIGNGWSVVTALVGPGDWDGDGRSDLVARWTDGTLWLYPGNGTGGFLSARQIGRAWNGMDLVTATGDFDGNGPFDLVARNRTDGSLWLYSGDGRGGFAATRRIGTGWGQMTGLLGPDDFDGDGRADLIARHSTGALYLYRGNGAGGFLGSRVIGSGWSGLRLVG